MAITIRAGLIGSRLTKLVSALPLLPILGVSTLVIGPSNPWSITSTATAIWLGWLIGQHCWVNALKRLSWRSQKPRCDLFFNDEDDVRAWSVERT